MFTGIIEDLGMVTAISGSKIEVLTKLDRIANGDSISINGICLTVTGITVKGKSSTVTFDYTPETAGLTTLNTLKSGTKVNLERSLNNDSRLGGHFVTGHIEGSVKISNIIHTANSYILSFEAGQKFLRYIVNKGSVAINGISLTVADRSNTGFSVSVIPFTYANTDLKFKKKGEIVNIETDIIAKYVENMIGLSAKNNLNMEFLRKNGFK